MVTILAQIAPQRSTQYTELATALAPAELRLSTFGDRMGEIRACQLGGLHYLQFDLPSDLDEAAARELGTLSMTNAFFVYRDYIGDVRGPFLRPIETGVRWALPPDLLTTRRYRGKTNEMFTQLMLNIARASSALAGRPWDTLRVFDPLCGGGTTLFAALILGASAAGVEHNAKDVESTATYLQGFLRTHGIAAQAKHERVKGLGRRHLFAIGKDGGQTCLLAHGDTAASAALVAGFRPHLIVTDLPYGIQHRGQLEELLGTGLPVWADLLPPSGALVIAWESSRYPRADLIKLVEQLSPLSVLNDPPYDAFAHRVDRVIRQRDLLVARHAAVLEG